ncbi:MAG: hypothetical protein MAG451_00936 [Anaerolineales bacterium]|nr:hypothetical protein [Anaerolineales bacterium]
MPTPNRRRLGVILYVLCLAALLFTGSLAAFGQHWLHRGIAYGQSPEIPLASVYPYGVNTALEQYTPAERDQVLSQLASDGFRWVRQVLPWNQVEPQQGKYEWSPWDQIVEDVDRHDLHLILVIDRAPAWASASPATDPRALPAEPADLANFTAAVVERYGDRLAAAEIWREPNLQLYRAEDEPWAAGPDPAQYVAHLQAAHTAAKSIDSEIVVLNAGLAPTTENSQRAMSDVNFLESMYDAGAAPYFDALAARPLGFWSGPDDRRVNPDALNFSRTLLLREIMARHGDAGKAIWAVEFGWNALPADWSGPAPPWGTDDVQKQARRTVEAVRRAQAEWPWMGPMLALHLDPAAPPDDPIQGFALLNDGLEPRPSYTALADRISQDTVGLGRYSADAWFTGTEWQPADNATVQRAPDGDIIISRPSLFGVLGVPPVPLFYLALGLLAVTAGVVAWRLDHLVRLPRWELAFTVVIAIFLLSPWLVLTLANLLILFALFVLRPDLALATIVLFIPVFRYPKYFGPQPVSVLELFTWLALAAWLVRQLSALIHTTFRQAQDDARNTQHASRFTFYVSRFTFYVSRFTSHVSRLTPLDYAVIFLALISLPSPLIAANAGVAIHELRVVIIDSALLYFLVRSAGLSRWGRRPDPVEGVWRLVDALVLAGLLIALYGFYQYIFSGDVIVAEGVRRMRSVYPSPNNLSLLLGRVAPIAGVVAVWGAVRWRRLFYGTAGLIIAGALFLTFSRAAWLVGLPAAALFVGVVRGRRALTVAVATVLTIVLSVLPFAGTARIRSLFELSPGSSTYRRIKLWQAALSMIRDHPVLGVGLDNFLYQYREKYLLTGARDDPSLSHPHNLILDFWTRLGILGMVVLCWLVAAFFRTTWRLYRRLDETGQVLTLGLMASMVYTLAHGFLDHAYFLVDLAYVFMLTLGIASRLDLDSEQGNDRTG